MPPCNKIPTTPYGADIAADHRLVRQHLSWRPTLSRSEHSPTFDNNGLNPTVAGRHVPGPNLTGHVYTLGFFDKGGSANIYEGHYMTVLHAVPSVAPNKKSKPALMKVAIKILHLANKNTSSNGVADVEEVCVLASFPIALFTDNSDIVLRHLSARSLPGTSYYIQISRHLLDTACSSTTNRSCL
jgi:hypothetical protein